MSDFMKSGRTSRVQFIVSIVLAVVLAGCGLIPLPESVPIDPGQIRELPGIPRNMDEVQDLMRDMGLPDLSRLADVPGLEDLPQLSPAPGTIVYQGPIDQPIEPGERVPGTDIELLDVNSDMAVFLIDGLRAERRIGDSLDFDGAWPDATGIDYSLRLRIYRVSSSQVRAAGVHRLTIDDTEPRQEAVELGDEALRFPYTVAADQGADFPGLTLGYGGEDERGAVLTGLADDEYPYRKLADSITWTGYLRPDLPVEYHLRMLYYQDASARVGGVVLIALPGL